MSGSQTFQLISRRRLIGLTHGTMRSVRRGRGTEVAGSRPYRPGDDIRSIDWGASARMSSARGRRRVRRPRALRRRGAARRRRRRPQRRALLLLAAAALARQGRGDAVRDRHRRRQRRPGGRLRRLPGLRRRRAVLAAAAGRAPARLPARGAGATTPAGAPRPDGVERSLEHLFEHRRNVTAGSFVFVFSDFLDPPSRETWLTAVEHLWDVIPVVIQDPVWEQSFPDVSGIVVPLRDPRSGRITHVRLTKKEAGGAAPRQRGAAAGAARGVDACSTSIPCCSPRASPPTCSAPSSTGTSSAARGAGWWRSDERPARSGGRSVSSSSRSPPRAWPSSCFATTAPRSRRSGPCGRGRRSPTGSSSSATPCAPRSTSQSTCAMSIRAASGCASASSRGAASGRRR